MQKFTVVGVYEDNNQTYVTSVDAPDAQAAAEAARDEVSSNIYVLAVFAGDHQDLHGKDEMMDEEWDD